MANETYSAAVLPVPGTLLLPGTTLSLKNLSRTEAFRLQEGTFAAIPVKTERTAGIRKDTDFEKYGVLCTVTITTQEKDTWHIEAQALERILITKVIAGRFPACTYEAAPETEDLSDASREDMLVYIKDTVRKMAANFRGGEHIARTADSYENINQLICYLAQFMHLSGQERCELLAENSMKSRSLHFIDLLLRQKEQIALNLQMNEKFSEQAAQIYRKQALERQLEAIKNELKQLDGDQDTQDDTYTSRIQASAMPADVKKDMLEEAEKLENSAGQGMEADNIRTYLEFALSLPWKKEPVISADLKKARQILDSRHYGMDKVKERIIQHLAVMKLRNTNKGSALLLVGPPGTGKTSLGKSIAEALSRKYERISLGGIRDESEIRGHRRTYVGAVSGRLLQSIKHAGTTNPVLVLDEMDKLMQGGFSGDPAAAMLEVLDPEQNNSFTDHYLDQPYDLSDIFFIGTANSLDSIPAPLLDRMEVIEISSYTSEEKFQIARRHLIPEVLADHGIASSQLTITDQAIQTMIENYTMEAGCRGLKKRIAHLCRAKSEQISEGQTITIEKDDLEDIFGLQTSRHEKIKDSNPPGVMTGLAWTAAGGEVLFIETADMPGNGQLILTGQLGDVMKESARISMSVLKSRLPLDTMRMKERDIHIHFPAGATPKDGPSAGITMFTALASLATSQPVDSHIAMTGELSLRGDVLPIGGLKEKLFGAVRAGITKVIIPWDNRADLREVPATIKDRLEIIPVKTVEEVLQETLAIHLPPIHRQTFADFAINVK